MFIKMEEYKQLTDTKFENLEYREEKGKGERGRGGKKKEGRAEERRWGNRLI